MMKLSPKAKKVVILTGIVCVGIASVVVVNLNSGAAADKNTGSKNSSATIALSSGVMPGSISGDSAALNSSKTTFNPETESSRSEPLTSNSKYASQPPKPTVKGDSKNGSQPTNSALTDKNKKPAYKTTPRVSAKKSSSKSSTSTKKSTGGSTKGNSVLNNAIKEQGGNQETTVDGDWGTGSQVGIMD